MAIQRCDWVGKEEIYINYHDLEWGKPVYEDSTLFEFLVLEGFQAGLSWITILKKRENFRKAFDNFDYTLISKYDQKKLDELLVNDGIIRNKLKINSIVTNSIHFMNIQKEFDSFSNYIWSYVNYQPIVNGWENINDVPTSTPLSDLISKDLKQRGFKFVGTTIIYSYLQAVGVINDHLKKCICYKNLALTK
ncbi:DNA-3-methyladenine glycosylase I [Apibacter muscae]|uniref:DNA-3-methyladenine glycosylase I n=1 Tax=Apibacter muscae TaxID=2509004 RepID=A0A563DBL3_9FLAO|nr:DNA-3-methyladenine glycosylase I [Apibacter muscae]TWP27449.1 DNA-3-methyladenine glycosylase I [Apibacter muscae]